MGTIVLSPQDCLSSPHSRQNHYFSSMAYRPSSASRAGRSVSQASIAVSLPSSDCTRRDSSGGAIAVDGRGLLPIPHHARASSKNSPPSEVPSQLCSPSPRGGRAAPSISKPKFSRTVSVILPSPQGGALPLANGERLHLLKGRLPFKVVQGNGLGNVVEAAPNTNLELSKKFVDVRSGVLKKFSNTSEHARGLRKREYSDGHQGSKSASKVSQDGGEMKAHPKEVDGKTVKGRRLKKSHSVKEVGEKSRRGEIPVVTILQRPKNKEAAAELIAKFFQEAAGPEVSDVKNERGEGTSDDSNFKKSDGIGAKRSETEGGIFEGSSEFESSSEVSTCQTSSFPSTEHVFLGLPGPAIDADAQEVPIEGAMDEIHLTLAATTMSECVVGQRGVESSNSPKEMEMEMDMAPGSGCDDFVLWERWAGPAYFNSPPPSSLPLPRFPRKQSKTQPSSFTEQYEEVTSDQIPARSSSRSPSLTPMSGSHHSGIVWDAVATATKDLRRILNLDL